jgi:hypothetical protein
VRTLAIVVLLAACGDDDGGVTGGDAAGGGDGLVTPDGAPPPTTGSIDLFLEADRGAANDAIVSLGVTFPPGALTDPTQLAVFDAGGAAVARHTASLATWPGDASQRAVLVAFRATLASGASSSWRIDYGMGAGEDAGTLAAAPDGPVAAWLDPAWYAASRATGYGVPEAANTVFREWEIGIEDYLATMDPGWETYGLSCDTTSQERTYYDGPHALYQRFTHRGGAEEYRRAREEATWYRANEIDWYDNNEVALYSCQPSWDPTEPLDWGVLRRMLGQGMLDDWLLSGDPEARRTLAGLGEAFLRDLDALTTGGEITVEVTERNMAWPMMGLASYYAIDHRADILAGLTKLVDMAVAWQARGPSGAFEHDIVRPDPSECGDGPMGGSPFMTSLLIDGLMDTWFLTGDARIPSVVVKAAEWYRDDAVTSDGVSFEYLWGCNDTDYDDSTYADLNVLISHVFGAAYLVSGDAAWLDFGDTMAQHGLDNLYAGAPKQWSQSTRSFIKYMGYRAEGRAP